MTGRDWLGHPEDLEFRSIGSLSWTASNYRSLLRRGYLASLEANLKGDVPVLLANPRGAVGREELLLGLRGRSPIVSAVSFGHLDHARGLTVYEALAWDDASEVARAGHGRSLVIEYPPDPGTRWTRFWRFGDGWPDESLAPVAVGLGVPGLVPMSKALDLLRTPDQFTWVPDSAETWGGANRWLDRGATGSPIVSAFLFCAAVVSLFGGLLYLGVERRNVVVRLLCQAVIVGPAADCLAGNVARLIGGADWPIQVVCSELLLLAVSFPITFLGRRRNPDLTGLFGPCLVGGIVLTASQPLWSDLSDVFRLPVTRVPPEMVGAWIGYLTASFALIASLDRRGVWFGRIATVALLLWSSFWEPWWVNGVTSYALLPIVPMVAAEGALSVPFLIYCALVPTSLAGLQKGIAWAPNGLLLNGRDAGDFNAFGWVRFLASPMFLASCVLGLFSMVEASGFAAHKLRTVMRSNPKISATLHASSALFAIGVFNPEMLFGALTLAIGGLLLLVYESLD
jgi:hypothetical protein